MPTPPKTRRQQIATNVLAALTVSFIALSLGAAFGLMSRRGAFAGMLSAALIPIVTSALGGTRIQVSGPTAPMTAVISVVVAFAYENARARWPGFSPDQFVTIVLLLSAVFLLVGGLVRLGRIIRFVPNSVLSGFMSGISVLIVLDQARLIFGFGGRRRIGGALATNIAFALITTGMILMAPLFLRRVSKRLAAVVSGTLLAIVLMTLVARLGHFSIERVSIRGIDNLSDLARSVSAMLPRRLPSWPVLRDAVPWAAQVALLCYLDSLLTALVVDRLTNTTSDLDKELRAQGFATAVVAPFGGIAGAQATIRSVLILNEGATTRWAGVLCGVFVLIETFSLEHVVSMIPKAVFAGVLLKVAWDVLDHRTIGAYMRRWRPVLGEQRRERPSATLVVTHFEMFVLVATAVVTVTVNLNVAVVAFTLFWHAAARIASRRGRIEDLPEPPHPDEYLP